jgi:hypothetical protein
MQWTLFNTGRALFWLANVLALFVAVGLSATMYFKPETSIYLPWIFVILPSAWLPFARLGLLLMVVAGIRDADGDSGRHAVRIVAWFSILFGVGSLYLQHRLLGPAPVLAGTWSAFLQLIDVLLIVGGAFALMRKPIAQWWYLGAAVLMVLPLLDRLMRFHPSGLSSAIQGIARMFLPIALAAATFILLRAQFRHSQPLSPPEPGKAE